MNTNDAAEMIGTTPRILRQFLRSPSSTYAAVGSGARYEFTDRDLPTLRKRFADWAGNGRPKPTPRKSPKQANGAPKLTRAEAQRIRDQEVWTEEDAERAAKGLGRLTLPDIRDPRVLARVRASEGAREQRLDALLMSRGMHITQLGDR